MRGDEDAFSDEALLLTEVDSLKGVPVFSSSGAKVGVLEKAVIHRNSGTITHVVVSRRRLFGLRRERFLLPRAALTAIEGRGGFVVDRAPIAAEAPDAAPLTAPALPPTPLRLDPARAG